MTLPSFCTALNQLHMWLSESSLGERNYHLNTVLQLLFIGRIPSLWEQQRPRWVERLAPNTVIARTPYYVRAG